MIEVEIMFSLKKYKIFFTTVFISSFTYDAFGLICATENTAIKSTAPTTDFIINSDGTATHLKTGLIWMRCNLGETWSGSACTGTASKPNWGTALQTADQLSFAGYNDWRIPNRNELESISELRCSNPAINQEVFPTVAGNAYWTSTQAINYSFAVIVNFVDGNVFSEQKSAAYVRALVVRGGQ